LASVFACATDGIVEAAGADGEWLRISKSIPVPLVQAVANVVLGREFILSIRSMQAVNSRVKRRFRFKP
jgi:hypothetical protein